MKTDMRIDYVEWPATNLESAERFYQDTFGWEFTSYGPEYISFTDGGMAGGFFKADLASRTGQGAALIVLYAKDLEACRDRVKAHGGEIRVDIFDFPGGRRFHFLDPNGNELAVWSE